LVDDRGLAPHRDKGAAGMVNDSMLSFFSSPLPVHQSSIPEDVTFHLDEIVEAATCEVVYYCM
jgi:hypothetical protein